MKSLSFSRSFISLGQLALFFQKALGKPLDIYLKLKDFEITFFYII